MIQLEYINTKEHSKPVHKGITSRSVKYLLSKFNICNIYIQFERKYQDTQIRK